MRANDQRGKNDDDSNNIILEKDVSMFHNARCQNAQYTI